MGMRRELDHAELRELLGAFALDAVDGDERDAVERHLAECRPCRTEVAEHREVAALMASGWVPAPEGVWDSIAAVLEETPPAMRLPSVPPPVVSLDEERERRRAGWPRPLRIAAAVGAAAAIVIVTLLGVKIVDTSEKVNDLVPGDNLERVAAAAAQRPDARTVALRSSDGRAPAEAVLLPDGTGYLVRNELPALPANRTYQLWAVVGSNKISIGVLGSKPGPAAFHAPPDAAALAITNEVSGGVVVSYEQPTAVGTVA